MYGIFIKGKLAKARNGTDVVVETYSQADKIVGVCAKHGVHAMIKYWEEEFGGGGWVDIPTVNPSVGMSKALYGAHYTPPPTPKQWKQF